MTFFTAFLPSARCYFLLACLLWLSCAANAQIVHDRVFGTPAGVEQLHTMLALHNGGYLLIGNQNEHFYLLRQDTEGDTIWTRRFVLPGCFGYQAYRAYAVEDLQGRVLISGQSFSYSGISGTDAFLAMFSPQGDTLWTKRMFSLAEDQFSQPHLLPNGNFLIASQLNDTPTLQQITPTGQVVWQRFPRYSSWVVGSAGELFPSITAGHYWLTMATNGPYKFIEYDDAGTAGAEISPVGLYISNVAPSGAGYYAIGSTSSSSEIIRLDAGFNVQWQRPTVSGSTTYTPRRILPLVNGNLLVGSDNNYNSFRRTVALHTISPIGQVLHDTAFYNPYAGPGLGLNVRGLAVDPPTGDYIFAGYSDPGPIGWADIFWTQLHHRVITSTRASQVPGQRWQAYPNPLAADGRLHLLGEQPLRGTLRLRDALGRQLASWPASGVLSQTLSLPPTLSTGTYLLTLESPELPPRTLRLVQP